MKASSGNVEAASIPDRATALVLWCICPPVLMSWPPGASNPKAVTNRSTSIVLGNIRTLDIISSMPALRICAEDTQPFRIGTSC